MSLETSKQIESLDSDLFRRFEQLGAFQAYEYLDGDKGAREATKKAFLSGEVRNPTLDYPNLSKWLRGEIGSPAMSVAAREQALLQLKRDAEVSSLPEAAKMAYKWRLNEKIAELRMMKAVDAGDMTAFGRYNAFVYGVPSESVFKYSVRQIEASVAGTTDPQQQAAGKDLLALLPNADAITTPDESKRSIEPWSIVIKQQFDTITPPAEAAVAEARQRIWESMGVLADLLKRTHAENKDYDAPQIKSLFDEALDLLKAEGWNVQIATDSKTGISVHQESKTVKIPAARKVNSAKLAGLIAHEIGIHVGRRVRGERSQLQLLALGLDRYEGGEEGVTTQAEKVIEGKPITEFSGLEAHLAISLARGCGLKDQPRDFRDVYEVLYRHFYCQKLPAFQKKLADIDNKKAQLAALNETEENMPQITALQQAISELTKVDPTEALIKESQDAAWNRSVRTFRGTDCKTPGVCFTKDMIYREGQIGTWDITKMDPNQMVTFSVGKFDPNDPRHLWVLQQLKITDQDLGEAA